MCTVLRPDSTLTAPPDPLVPLPTLMLTIPPRPPVATPEPKNKAPLFPLLADPELNTSRPLTPFVPAFALRIEITPLLVAVPSPLSTLS